MAPLATAVSLAIIASATLVQAELDTCFNLFGQEDDSLRPCDPSAKVSACCRKDDICLSSGLCMSTASSWAGFIWANGCTDATHEDPKCPNQCTDKTSVNASSSYNVLQCTYPFSNDSISRDPQWCCRSATSYDNCCGDPNLTFNDTQSIGLFLTPGSTQAINPADDYILASDCSTNATSSNTTASAAAAAVSSCPADHTAAVGGAVGGVLGALLLLAIAAIVLLLLGRRTLKSQVTSAATQRDDALRQISDEKALMTQLRQQQQQQQAHFAGGAPMYGYQQSNAFGYSQSQSPSPAAPGYGDSHIYAQFNSSSRSMSMGPAEMSAVKAAELDGHAPPTELSVQEVRPTPVGSAHGGGSVKSKGSS